MTIEQLIYSKPTLLNNTFGLKLQRKQSGLMNYTSTMLEQMASVFGQIKSVLQLMHDVWWITGPMIQDSHSISGLVNTATEIFPKAQSLCWNPPPEPVFPANAVETKFNCCIAF